MTKPVKEVDENDDEVRILRESLHANDVIPLLDPAEFLTGA
jgi:hypothetical protein